MTIHEIETSTKEVLCPKDICEVLHCKPYTLNVTAKEGRLSIPHSFVGNRLKIPRQAFLKWFLGSQQPVPTTQKTALLQQDGQSGSTD